MPLSWNEIKTRASAFSKHWQDAKNEDRDAARVAFLFNLYQQITSLLPAEKPKKKKG